MLLFFDIVMCYWNKDVINILMINFTLPRSIPKNLTVIVYIESNAYSTSNECMTEKIYDVFAGMRRSVLFAKKCGNCQLESMPLNYTDRYKYRVSYPYFLFWHKHAVSKRHNKDVSVQRMQVFIDETKGIKVYGIHRIIYYTTQFYILL